MLEQSHEQLVLLSLGQSDNAADCGLHFGTRRNVRRMYGDFGWLKVGGSDLFFNPQNHIVTSSMGIIAQVMVETQVRDTASFQQLNDFIWPTTSMPSVRGWAFIIKVDLQFRFPSISVIHQHAS